MMPLTKSLENLDSIDLLAVKLTEVNLIQFYSINIDLTKEESRLKEASFEFSIIPFNLTYQKIEDLNISYWLKGSNDVKYLTLNYSQSSPNTRDSISAYISEDQKIIVKINNIRDIIDSKEEAEIIFSFNITYKTERNFPKIKEEIPFPYSFSNEELKKLKPYLEPSELINSDHYLIRELSQELLLNETDYYSAVMSIARFVKEIVEYTPLPETEEEIQRASWTLINKIGVCDEITILFAALLRASGIPVRIVSGTAYTNNALFDKNWENHAWAEVYFPNFGWVPFDITYGEFGYTNPLRVIYDINYDAEITNLNYSWLGSDADVKAKKDNQEIKYNLLDKDQFSEYIPKVNITVIKEEVGYPSYNLIKLEIKNPYEYYLPLSLDLNLPKEIVVINKSNNNPFVLKPKEERTIYFLIYISNNFEKRYVYTIPFSIRINYESFNSSFKVDYRSKRYDHNYLLDNFVYEKDKTQEERKFKIICNYNEKIYVNTENQITCNLDLKDNLSISGKICLSLENHQLDCESIDSKEGKLFVNLSYSINETGMKKINLLFNNEEINSFNIEITNTPNVNIIIKEINNLTDINDKIINLTIVPSDDIFNVSLFFKSENDKNNRFKVNLDDLSFEQDFILRIDKRSIQNKQNSFLIELIYFDFYGNQYTLSKNINITLQNVSFLDRIILFLRRIFL